MPELITCKQLVASLEDIQKQYHQMSWFKRMLLTLFCWRFAKAIQNLKVNKADSALELFLAYQNAWFKSFFGITELFTASFFYSLLTHFTTIRPIEIIKHSNAAMLLSLSNQCRMITDPLLLRQLVDNPDLVMFLYDLLDSTGKVDQMILKKIVMHPFIDELKIIFKKLKEYSLNSLKNIRLIIASEDVRYLLIHSTFERQDFEEILSLDPILAHDLKMELILSSPTKKFVDVIEINQEEDVLIKPLIRYPNKKNLLILKNILPEVGLNVFTDLELAQLNKLIDLTKRFESNILQPLVKSPDSLALLLYICSQGLNDALIPELIYVRKPLEVISLLKLLCEKNWLFHQDFMKTFFALENVSNIQGLIDITLQPWSSRELIECMLTSQEVLRLSLFLFNNFPSLDVNQLITGAKNPNLSVKLLGSLIRSMSLDAVSIKVVLTNESLQTILSILINRNSSISNELMQELYAHEDKNYLIHLIQTYPNIDINEFLKLHASNQLFWISEINGITEVELSSLLKTDKLSLFSYLRAQTIYNLPVGVLQSISRMNHADSAERIFRFIDDKNLIVERFDRFVVFEKLAQCRELNQLHIIIVEGLGETIFGLPMTLKQFDEMLQTLLEVKDYSTLSGILQNLNEKMQLTRENASRILALVMDLNIRTWLILENVQFDASDVEFMLIVLKRLQEAVCYERHPTDAQIVELLKYISPRVLDSLLRHRSQEELVRLILLHRFDSQNVMTLLKLLQIGKHTLPELATSLVFLQNRPKFRLIFTDEKLSDYLSCLTVDTMMVILQHPQMMVLIQIVDIIQQYKLLNDSRIHQIINGYPDNQLTVLTRVLAELNAPSVGYFNPNYFYVSSQVDRIISHRHLERLFEAMIYLRRLQPPQLELYSVIIEITQHYNIQEMMNLFYLNGLFEGVNAKQIVKKILENHEFLSKDSNLTCLTQKFQEIDSIEEVTSDNRIHAKEEVVLNLLAAPKTQGLLSWMYSFTSQLNSKPLSHPTGRSL